MRIGIIIQRAYAEIVGGAETEALQFARVLREEGEEVEIITTTALDPQTWLNEFPEGQSMIDEVPVKRFSVDCPRKPDWFVLHRKLVEYFVALRSYNRDNLFFSICWPEQLQEEWIRLQGPHSLSLLEYLRDNSDRFDRFIFFSYLYSTAYFGMKCISAEKRIFVPTLHDEPSAYLSVFSHAAKNVQNIIWNSDSEKKLGERIWGVSSGVVVGSWIDIPDLSTSWNVELAGPAFDKVFSKPYILYSGRMDKGKGCAELVSYFKTFLRETGSNVNLVFIGKGDYIPPRLENIIYLGFVEEDVKKLLLSRMIAFVMPSTVESLSISTLEAMAWAKPVIINGNSQVLTDHVRLSSGGVAYHNEGEFVNSLKHLLADNNYRNVLGSNGRDYVAKKYSRREFVTRLYKAIGYKK